ncbi:hypothetical protein IKE67_07995 [bacterium]|nr:hypothetical protein [bacterium]
MGMSSSQARLLSITARINDVEFKSQSIANTKIRLADESEQVSREYTEALGKTKLMYTTWNSTTQSMQQIELTGDLLMNADSHYKLYKVGATDSFDTTGIDQYTLYEMIESGEFYLKKDGEEISVSGDNQLALGSVDSVKLAQAEAEYNAATARINRKEKLLDNEMKALDTEHNALKTEQDSIKSLIKDNVDKTFNIFG